MKISRQSSSYLIHRFSPHEKETPALKINSLSYRYNNHKALDNLNFEVGLGERLAVVGPNGAGKSTLMLHLNGILTGKGQVQVGGLEITKKNLPSIRAMVGMVFQNPDDQLFSPTVYEDVAFGPENLALPPAEIPETRALLEFLIQAEDDSFRLGGSSEEDALLRMTMDGAAVKTFCSKGCWVLNN